VNYSHLFIALVITGWVLSVEYRLWANLKILNETLAIGKNKPPRTDRLHAVEK
jgi:hypothetical protein